MTPAELEAARRVVTLPGWRWMPGMLAVLPDAPPVRIVEIYDAGNALQEHGWLPDLSDPATLGCLEALVRERHPGAYVVPDVWTVEDRSGECGAQGINTAPCRLMKGHRGHHTSWPPPVHHDGPTVAGFSVMAVRLHHLQQIRRGLTRGEALVAALGAE